METRTATCTLCAACRAPRGACCWCTPTTPRRPAYTGDRAEVRSATGAIVVPVEVTDEVMRGVVCLPHGWGRDRPGVRLSVAGPMAGANVNAVTDEASFDASTRTSDLSAVVTLARVFDAAPGG